MVLEVVLVVLEVVLQLLLLQLLLLFTWNEKKLPRWISWGYLYSGIIIRTPSKQITKVTNSSLLVGQTASGPPSYIQVRHPGADFRGPGAQKDQSKSQKQKKRVILSPLSDLLQNRSNVLLLPNSN